MSDTGYQDSATAGGGRSTSGPARHAVSVLEVTDPADTERTLPQLALDLVKLGPTRFYAKRIVLDVDGCVLVYHFAAHPIRSRSQLAGPYQVIATYSPRTTGTMDGRALTPDLLVTAREGAEPELVAGGGYRSVLFFVPPAELERHVQVDGAGPHFLAGDVVSVQRLYEWGRSVLRAAGQNPGLFNENRTIRDDVRRELRDRLGDAVASSRSFVTRDKETTSVNHSRLVKKVQDWALEHLDRHVYLRDLCQAGRVSERTLRYAFHHVLGMSPVAYLSRLRLHRVHKTLKNAVPGSTTVTAEALNWGFWHGGEFAKLYKECFGELPSDTLSREP